ncbi:Putative membrane protein [Alteribacillus persepolensis]|uniref:Putative membrane protein n=1 Tax=Alteribacillus persepolensis TaxID=568899 RepID=A0A1G8DZ71_9BACI|nr:YuiB family protein [Alteribacillus persepolensis]SDH62885.1 Putative membrane protein [Alteribacillus persepolensis]
MGGIGSLPQLIISMMLFLLLFFGIGFLLNMILRSTWVMAVLYPLVVVAIIDNVSVFDYILSPASSFQALGQDIMSLQVVDIIILTCGMAGAVIAGIAIRMLRVRGYQMF